MKNEHFAIIMMSAVTAITFITTIAAIVLPDLLSLGPKTVEALHAFAVFTGIGTFACGSFLTAMITHLFDKKER